MIAFSATLYCFYGDIFHSEEVKLTAWAVTQGVVNVLLSPARMLIIFKA